MSEMSVLVHEGIDLSTIDKSKIGFVLTRTSTAFIDAEQADDIGLGPDDLQCLLENSDNYYNSSEILFTWEDVQEQKQDGVFVFDTNVGIASTGRPAGEYMIHYNNCNFGSAVSFK